MSAKSRFKPQKLDLKPKDPRQIPVIQEEFAKLASQTGQLQYQMYALRKELKNMNDQMMSLSYEAANRQKLDAEAAAKAKEGDKDEQVQQS